MDPTLRRLFIFNVALSVLGLTLSVIALVII